MYELSEKEEECLEELYRFECDEQTADKEDIEKAMSVKCDNFEELLSKLQSKKLIKIEDENIFLTEEGSKVGQNILKKHHLSELLLFDVLGKDLPGVHEEACKLEHDISDKTADNIENIVNSESCPHGTKLLGEEWEDSIKLADGKVGNKYKVLKIPEDKASVTRLCSINILPGSKIKLKEKSFDTIIIKNSSSHYILSSELSENIDVIPIEKSQKKRKRKHKGKHR